MLLEPVSELERLEVLLRLVLAAVLGALLGWERSRADKPADTRTMVLIAVGAAAFALLGENVLVARDAGETIRTDPTRVLSYIISGVGFLGAGAILHSKRTVKGLTTAAAIWTVAGIGAACGLGEYLIAYFLFAIVFVTLWAPWVHSGFTGELSREENGQHGGAPRPNGRKRERGVPDE